MSSRGQPSRLSSITDQNDRQSHSVSHSSPAIQSTTSRASNHDKEQASTSGNTESLSRRMHLLALRKPRSRSALSKTRQKNLEEMKEKEKEADLMVLDILNVISSTNDPFGIHSEPTPARAFTDSEGRSNVNPTVQSLKTNRTWPKANAARLDSRLEIVNMFLHKSLVDDSFLGRKELNPWLFKNNSNLRDKWNFVHNMVTTQEMIIAIQSAKKRHKAEMEQEKQRRSAEVQQRSMEKENSKANQVEKVRKGDPSQSEMKDTKGDEPEQVAISLPVTKEQEKNENIQKPDDAERAEHNPQEQIDDNTTTPGANQKPRNDDIPKKPDIASSKTPKVSPVVVAKPRYRPSPRAKGKGRPAPTRSAKCHDRTVNVYAFGSTHKRHCCKYCQGGPKAFTDGEKSVEASSKASSRGMNERLDDINGIYIEDPMRKSLNEKMQERIHQVEEIMKERVVNFSEHMIKNGYVS